MSSPEGERGAPRSVLSWESVVGRAHADDPATVSEPDEPVEPVGPVLASLASGPPVTVVEVDDEPISLTIAPLTLEPLPKIPEAAPVAGRREGAVLGELHLDLPSLVAIPDPGSDEVPVIDASVSVDDVTGTGVGTSVSTEQPVVAIARISEGLDFDFTIAPFDLPDTSGRVPVVRAGEPAPDEPVAVSTAGAAPPLPSVPPSSLDDGMAALSPSPKPAPPVVVTLPPDAYQSPSLPQSQPSQAHLRPAVGRQSMGPAPATLSPRPQQRSAAGGVAMFLTLLVLAALVAGGVVFGRPYLFPDEWDEAARPYGEAVETVRGRDFDEPVPVLMQAGATYDVSMAADLVGDWNADLPMWRSLGLASGAVEQGRLAELVVDWRHAYYSRSLGEIVVDDSVSRNASDGAVIEAMVVAALHQETIDVPERRRGDIDGRAFDEAQTMATARNVAVATPFGAAISGRNVVSAEFLPPVLAYQVYAPIAFSEFVPEVGTSIDPIVGNTMLASARDPEFEPGDTVVREAEPTSRGLWYLVFASFLEPVDAYRASNALVQGSTTVVDRSGVTCTLSTFSGGGPEQVAVTTAALESWTAAAPAALGATVGSLPDGTIQFTSCDPGVGFELGGRFGAARELVRWRLVELAALDGADPATSGVGRANEVARVRAEAVGAALLGEPLDASAETMAELARTVARPAPVAVDPVDPDAGG